MQQPPPADAGPPRSREAELPKVAGPMIALWRIRRLLAAGYVAFVGFGLFGDWLPPVFWTMLLPLVPFAIVLIGFPVWRRICPLAFFGEAGRMLNRGAQRRVPAWVKRWFFPLTLGILLVMLVLRLVATNGDKLWLAGLLVGLALAAALANWIFTGKSWCNFFCPVGVVERIYTEPNSLWSTSNSQCVVCTACKEHCPDIDQENAYWRDLTSTGRRLAIYAFPGLVLAFYAYFWLRHGDWEAYFDGRWTRLPADIELLLGEGFFFAPEIPALLAATMTLLVFSAVSYGVFWVAESLVGVFVHNPEHRRHLVLALAAFAAFNIFYVFAGAPTLRRIPGATQAVAFMAPMVGTLFLVKRWRRTRQHFIGQRGAVRLVRNWPFDEPAPKDPSEAYGWIRASHHARQKDLAAYATTVREMIADRLIGPGEFRLLEGVRKQLGISEREHDQILDRLSEEERHLFADRGSGGVEVCLQLDCYHATLAEALVRSAPEAEIDELRQHSGVTTEDHEAVLEQIRGASGEFHSCARCQLEHALQLRRDFTTIGATEPAAAQVFLCYLLAKAGEGAVDRVLELLEIIGDGTLVRTLRRPLFAGDASNRERALELLAEACPDAQGLVRELEPLVARRPATVAEVGAGSEAETLSRLLAERNPYLRAGAVWAAADCPEKSVRDQLADALEDRHPLVRETAARFASHAEDMGSRTAVDPVLRAKVETNLSNGKPPLSTLSAIEIMYFLHSAPFLADLDPEDLYDLAQFAVEQSIAPPEVVYEEGDVDSDALFVVVSGKAAVFRGGRSDPVGAERKTSVLGRGDVIGELSVLDGSPRSASVRPEGGPVRVLRIPGHNLRSGLLSRSRVTEAVLGNLAGRIRRLST